MTLNKSPQEVYEALQEGQRASKVRKAKRLQEDIDTLHNPPEALKQDIAALCGVDSYEEAKHKLERL